MSLTTVPTFPVFVAAMLHDTVCTELEALVIFVHGTRAVSFGSLLNPWTTCGLCGLLYAESSKTVVNMPNVPTERMVWSDDFWTMIVPCEHY